MTNHKEVELACKTLKNGKTPGFDEISGEHLKYGGPKLWTVLCFHFNEMYKQNKGTIRPEKRDDSVRPSLL